jgi:hypothetical protein
MKTFAVPLRTYSYSAAPSRVVCFDETPRQLIGESRVPVAAKPGRPARFERRSR